MNSHQTYALVLGVGVGVLILFGFGTFIFFNPQLFENMRWSSAAAVALACPDSNPPPSPFVATVPAENTKLVVVDKEVHYAQESAAARAAARPLPVPASWASATGNATTYPKTTLSPRGETFEVFSGNNPIWIYKTSDGRVLQLGNVTGVGQFESAAGAFNNYVWYRISTDSGTTFGPWKAIIADGYSPLNPMPGVIVGKNAVFNGVSEMLNLTNGDIAVPVAIVPLDAMGNVATWTYNVGTFTQNHIVHARWNADRTDVTWRLGSRVSVPDTLSTRGAMEPAIAEIKNKPGTILMVSRGSNDPVPNNLPGRKWVSVSTDYGDTWSAPTPFCYDDGTCFYSPSSSSLLFRGPNGRLYWLGNITPQNPSGNEPRYPLVLGEVDETTYKLIKSTVITVDTYNPATDSPQVQFSNMVVFPDYANGSVLIHMLRYDWTYDPVFVDSTLPWSWYRIGFQAPTVPPPASSTEPVVLLHLDGANGATSFPDVNVGGSSHTWTAYGNARIDTSTSKFGGASAFFDGSDDWITTPDHSDFSLGSGDFTIDGWFNRAGGDNTVRFMFGQGDSTGSQATRSFQIVLIGNNTLMAYVFQGTSNVGITSTQTYTTAGWHHFAMVRAGSTLRFFIDGVQQGTGAPISGAINNSPHALSVGRLGEYPGLMWNGQVDEFRITKGLARWTSNFTPPASPHTTP